MDRTYFSDFPNPIWKSDSNTRSYIKSQTQDPLHIEAEYSDSYDFLEKYMWHKKM